MKFGLFYELSVPRPWTRESGRTVYQNALGQVKLADELGFDHVWAVEHHFLEEYSHCPAPGGFRADPDLTGGGDPAGRRARELPALRARGDAGLPPDETR